MRRLYIHQGFMKRLEHSQEEDDRHVPALAARTQARLRIPPCQRRLLQQIDRNGWSTILGRQMMKRIRRAFHCITVVPRAQLACALSRIRYRGASTAWREGMGRGRITGLEWISLLPWHRRRGPGLHQDAMSLRGN